MKAFLLLFAAQMLLQIAAQMKAGSHGHDHKGDICVASFWKDAIQTPAELDDQVVIIASDVSVSADEEISVGAIVAEDGAWMTIDDGAFVTIDTEQLDCGLEGCMDIHAPNKADESLGYNRKTGKLVSCDDKDDKPTETPEGPGFPTDTDTDTGFPTDTDTDTDTEPDKPDGESDVMDKLADYCPNYEGDEKIFTKDDDLECSKGADLSWEQCTMEGGNMEKAELRTCSRIVSHFKQHKSWSKIAYSTRNLFKMRCCQGDTDTDTDTDKPDGPKEPTPKPEDPEKPGMCKKTCKGNTCDYWGKESGFSCSGLKERYGCQCGGCECRLDKEIKQCAEDTCYGRTCTDWVENKEVTCGMLKNIFKCTCNGCNCKDDGDNKCQNELSGDGYCDDENNMKDCDWDGGDCCDYDDGKTHMEDQFSFCKDCECNDPDGSNVQRACKLPQYKGDGRCDDRNNKGSCNWDDGDCCGENVITTYCEDCQCKDPSHTGTRCIHSHLGDGFCDDANNHEGCWYDQGDCCNAVSPSQYHYCKVCQCLDPAAHELAKQCGGKCGSGDHKGDDFCDDDNNNCGCGWDGGDCCEKSGNAKQLSYCYQCACLDPNFVIPDCPVANFKGDEICDDQNNIQTCDWDGGDCCEPTGGGHPEQFDYCNKCECVA